MVTAPVSTGAYFFPPCLYRINFFFSVASEHNLTVILIRRGDISMNSAAAADAKRNAIGDTKSNATVDVKARVKACVTSTKKAKWFFRNELPLLFYESVQPE